ncbi:hypothetical protein F5887DRAFT_938906 [Amanita rubescens]|nr:hypothetical protein F5887DRAFT_938906 [Amanita rubescens]
MVISTSDYPVNVYLNFDYAIYTYVYSVIAPSAYGSNINPGLMNPIALPRRLQDLHPPALSLAPLALAAPGSAVAHHSSSNNNLGIIIGSVLGGLALVALVVALIFFRRGRRKIPQSIVLTQGSIATFDDRQQPMGYHDNISMINSHRPSGSIYNENTGSATLYNQSGHIRSPSSDVARQSPTLVPFRRGYQSSQFTSSTKSRDELRPLRQQEAHQRLQSAQLEMHDLQSMYSSLGAGSSSSDVRRPERDHELETIREQIRQLSSRMENMHVDRSADWEQRSNRTSEPPPAYD